MIEVLEKIAQKRKHKIQEFGFGFGHQIPSKRQVPLCPPQFDTTAPLMIAEIKRSSPSAGIIGSIPNPVSLAGKYLNNGAKVISVLTEEDHFNGSLKDLMHVKNTFKNATILRKDFIQYAQEISISYQAGADMVLLIIAMFIGDSQKQAQLEEILSACNQYSLTPLIEIHTQEECEFALKLNPKILGINSRNLHTFEIDKNKALYLKSLIPPYVKTIFESGIESSFDGYLAGTCDFDGMLCGSYLVKTEEKNQNLPHLIKAYTKAKKQKNSFYPYIFKTIANQTDPLIKICGITNIDDAIEAAQAGADMIGFILTKQSPRYVDERSIKQISKALNKLYPHVFKIGVITEDKQLFSKGRELFKEGILDCLQLHGINPLLPNEFACFDLTQADFNFYICVNFENILDYPKNSISPFVLLDSKTNLKGGSGKSIPLEQLQKLKNIRKNLFIAGGIGVENIQDILSLQPKMIDINSKIELSPGKKDKTKLQAILKKIKLNTQTEGF
ncbi:bifunctional indole-3-glycerol phosphate synthase/phosphoribosylanthranilate isomerase [Helicobacter sp. 11S03491-1]|uniref:bifunctional indole-3-glycerol phosphate synthase/phosphoribosylanthranilate isomerase n=1 Tax=Helicobacter sp. 11S03491-1 TaxID=1476196 RepID=UPI000BA63FF5|nr:bifunctional indole-3-glycerol phosphate synthase/phosphoribosylanthranilate isomerase [Helicobacter sp. 11S03491-1]PAF42579.1 hypothetical protein BKH45_03435 [Helicobacter sp. 11S03491-1]